MRLQVLYDNFFARTNFYYGWGFSLLAGNVLIDTGHNFEELFHNMNTAGIDPRQIHHIIITHDHWDHNGGLHGFLSVNNAVTVHITTGFSPELKQMILNSRAELVEHSGPARTGKLWTTGPIEGTHRDETIFEQSVVLETHDGLAVLTGCAHPGIGKIVTTVRNQHPGKTITAIVGGLHLHQKKEGVITKRFEQLKAEGVRHIAALHCSGPAAHEAGDIEGGSGALIELS